MYAPASSLHRWVFNDAFSAAAEATTALDAPLCPNFSKNFESATFSRYKKTMMSVEARVYASDADNLLTSVCPSDLGTGPPSNGVGC